MFFAFSKLLAFSITPAIWIIILLAVAVFSKNENRRKKCLEWSFGLFLFFSNGFIFTECMHAWEIPAVRLLPQKQYEAGIVLGGVSSYDEKLDRVQFYRSVDRLLQAIELYRKGVIKKIIFTGGSGLLMHPEMKEGKYLVRYLYYFNIPEKDFIIENESRNTRENALFTKEVLTRNQLSGRLLLITSGFHMRRSLGCFKKAEITIEPYSTDRFVTARSFSFDQLLIPNITVLDGWSTLLHEVVGYITYKLMGYA
jgi:uncharacterized SAM-binding protein YcdF (DUF218 family)